MEGFSSSRSPLLRVLVIICISILGSGRDSLFPFFWTKPSPTVLTEQYELDCEVEVVPECKTNWQFFA
jgi:hypothetical protein